MRAYILRELVLGRRWSEWSLAWVHTIFGATLVWPGSTYDASPIHGALAALAPETAMGAAFLAVGLARLAALTINGFWHRSPAIRMWGSCFGFAAFSALAAGFGVHAIAAHGVLSTAAGTYAVLAVTDLGNIWRASCDVGRIERTRPGVA